MTLPPNQSAVLDNELKDKLADIFSDAADKIAPKQPNGSIERKIALGMMAETLIPLIELVKSQRDEAARVAEREVYLSLRAKDDYLKLGGLKLNIQATVWNYSEVVDPSVNDKWEKEHNHANQ